MAANAIVEASTDVSAAEIVRLDDTSGTHCPVSVCTGGRHVLDA